MTKLSNLINLKMEVSKFESNDLSVLIDGTKWCIIKVNILGRTFTIKDSSVSMYDHKLPAGYNLAKVIHDNILKDQSIFKEIEKIVSSHLGGQTWRYSK